MPSSLRNSHDDPTSTTLPLADLVEVEKKEMHAGVSADTRSAENDGPLDLTSLEDGNGEVTENSPFPEVAASVPPTDEDLPVNTFRAWLIGPIMTMIISGLNEFFVLHNPPLGLAPSLGVIAALPVGTFMAKLLPTTKWSAFGRTWSLNPGPFNRKEHTMIATMLITSGQYDSGSVSSFVWTSLMKFFGMDLSVGYRILFMLTSQTMCLGLAGLFRHIVVEPAYCVWPAALPTCAMIHSMHETRAPNRVANGWRVSRLRFFWFALIGVTAFEFLPSYLFTGLTTFAWITWISPNNVTLAQVFGATSGMDLLPLTLDWNQITAYLGSPLVMPVWGLVNVVVGSVLFLWIIAPALHWSNVWYGKYVPLVSSELFDNTGSSYNLTRILNSDWTLNEKAYHDYSPIFLSTTAIISYGLGFASITSVIIHSYLYHRKDIWSGLKVAFTRNRENIDLVDEDVHTKIMRRYKPVPLWWFIGLFLASFGLAILFVEYYDTGLPWWGIVICIAINILVLVPAGIMMAMCNIGVSTNMVAALIGGFIWPGRMVAVVIFKILTFNTTGTAMVVFRDMKMGNYMKIPQRSIFFAQLIGTVLSCFTNVAVNDWALTNVKDICTFASSFICPISISYETSITFWGLIGPAKLFLAGATYNSMLYFFLIGAVLPVITFFVARRWPHNWIKKIHIPAVLSSIAAIPPATAGNYIPWAVVGLAFQVWIRNRWRPWWMKYNYLLSAALDTGLALSVFLIFFCLQYPGVNLSWWGNSIASSGADGLELPLETPAPGTHFGPDTWH